MNKFLEFILRVWVLLFITTFSFPLAAQINFTYQSDYFYLKGKDAGLLPGNWMNPGFNYSNWTIGKAPFRYGSGTGGTEMTDMLNGYSCLMLRSTFQCSNKDLIKQLTLSVDYNDGFVLWINGVRALYKNVPVNISNDSFATANHESGTGEIFTINASGLNLRNGTNYIAVQGFNSSLDSPDFYFDMEMHAETSLPEVTDTVGIGFSVKSGFFGSPFNLTLTSPDPSAFIVFTLDGSNPQNSVNSFTSSSPTTLLIDPESTTGRSLTPSVVIRASITRQGFRPSKPGSRTFIFIDKVKTQKWPGGEWPIESINGQTIDLEMDTTVVNNPEYSGLMEGSLLDIPSISIITDIKDLFDPASGIYVNAYGHGINWEKECSVELIQPDGSDGFAINAGLRIRGGFSRHGDFPKHAFRLFFRGEYGASKLNFRLFGDEGVSQFDKIDLRTEQDYAWSNGYSNNSAVREVFSRDSQRDMGQPYTRSRYYHLYLNGMYWGLYQTQERSEARYASSYFGGNSLDYDVIKVNTEDWSYTIEATDGNLDSWNNLWNLCNKGFESNTDYFALEGKDNEGKPIKGGEVLVNIDNLIDYMMVIFYTGTFDAPTSASFMNKRCNNFFAIDNRQDKSKGFTFYTHDAENSLLDEVIFPGAGLYEDRVNIGTRTDDYRMEVGDFPNFQPQWLHYKLTANPEYRIRFADKAYRYLNGEGVLGPARSLERLNKRAKEIEKAIIAESARWGDGNRGSSYPYTKNDNWLPEIDKIRNNYIPFRSDIVIDQLKVADLYPQFMPPVFNDQSGIISSTDYPVVAQLTIKIANPNSSGAIIYTLDGSDPRNTGGGINPVSLSSANDVDITLNNSVTVWARIFSDGKWSPARQVNFVKQDEDYSNLKVTELSYHPPDYISGADTTIGKDLEFIEFKNIGEKAINLSGLVLDSAVHYLFPQNELLAPKKFYVIASKPSKFFNFYGLIASGNFQGNFSNSGEEVLLTDSKGRSVIDFIYDDSPPWPIEADGNGFTLSSLKKNPTGDPAASSYWTLSAIKGGTPFADNLTLDQEPELPVNGRSLIIYPNPTTGVITVRLNANEEISRLDLILFDITGKQIRKMSTGNPGILDLAGYGLPSGTYILKVNSSKYSARIPVILIK